MSNPPPAERLLDANRAPVGATIRRPTAGLSGLPRPSETVFGDRAPWSVVTTGSVVAALGVDRGNWATWRCRGIGPAELPPTWFRPALGGPRYYSIDVVLSWLAARHCLPYDVEAAHLDYLRAVHMPPNRVWVRRLAESAGPRIGDVTFTAGGWREYLDSLAAG